MDETMTAIQEAWLEYARLAPHRNFVPAQDISYTPTDGLPKTFVEPPHFNGDCCGGLHFYKDGNGEWHSLPDEKVCARERSWRKYIRIRDGIGLN